MTTKPRTKELVKSSYQPTRAELEEKITLDFPPGLTVEERFTMLADSMLNPVNIRWIDKPRSRR